VKKIDHNKIVQKAEARGSIRSEPFSMVWYDIIRANTEKINEIVEFINNL